MQRPARYLLPGEGKPQSATRDRSLYLLGGLQAQCDTVVHLSRGLGTSKICNAATAAALSVMVAFAKPHVP